MHESYIIPGVVDGAVVRAQAEKRAADKRHPEDTLVHDHREGEECNDYCRHYKAVSNG